MNFGSLGVANILQEALVDPARDFDEIQVIAVASRDKKKAKEFALSNRIKNYYGNYLSLLKDKDINAIYIPLPNSHHYEWAKKALLQGKHVLCEKPLCSNGFEAFSLFEIAKEKNLILLEAYHQSFHPMFKRLKEIIEKDVIGDIDELNGKFLVNIPKPDIRFDYSLSGGAFMDPGCYLIHAMVHFLSGDAEIISTEVKTLSEDLDIDIESKAKLLLRNNIKINIHSSIVTSEDMEIWIEFIGKKGRVKLNNFVRSNWCKMELEIGNQLVEENFSKKSTFSYQLEAFLEMTKKGANQKLEEESKSVMKLLDELYIHSELPIRGQREEH